MPNHFYLPEIDSNSNIPVPKETAHWFNNDKKIILGISDGIVIDEQAKTRGISSIPDIWARPLLFQSALKIESKHPLKKRCVQEWRGLLSIIALHKIKPALAGLEFITVSLGDEKFSKALRNLTPKSVQLERNKFYDWNNVIMIRLNGIPIGAFSPTSLVFTGADYAKRIINESFSYKDTDGYLMPPQTREDGIDFVGEWLYYLKIKMNELFFSDEENEPDRHVIQNINALIDEWLKEIRIELGLHENDPIDVENYKVSEERVEVSGHAPFLNNYEIYQRLLYPLKADEGSNQELLISDVLLKSTRNKEKKVLVITEKILSDPVNIWNELRPNDLGADAKSIVESFFRSASGTRINKIDLGENMGMWIRPELYFLSDKLLKGRGNDFLNISEEELNIGTKYVLPFKKEILDFFTPKEIKENLNPFFKEDNGLVKFSFTLPVGNFTVRVEKTFKTKTTSNLEGEIVDTEIPVIEIFPDYLGPNWKKYYLFQGKLDNFNVNPILFDRNCIINDRVREFKQKEFAQKVKIYEIAGENPFPEAVEISSEANIPYGLVLISTKEKNPGLKYKWTVGIDFGTSNSNVYKYRENADIAESWNYNFPEYYRSITLSDSVTRKKILDEYFFPTNNITLPIPTTLKLYHPARKESMVLDYFIYHPVEYKFPEDVLSDIKWEGEGTVNFLESLLFLLLIEIVKDGVAEVKLACSFPKAFSNLNIATFKIAWEEAYNNLFHPDDKKRHHWTLDIHSRLEDTDFKVNIIRPVFETEGVAAGNYFASEKTIPDLDKRANIENAAICLDVGGGTTDISIWFRDKIAFDASVLLAGREISNLVQKNSRIRELLFSKEAAIALEEKKNEPGYFNARLNLILKKEGDEIPKKIGNLLSKYKDIHLLRQLIALEFGALSFFAAQVCISTDERVQGGLWSRLSEAGINLHWGGNAAKLINWIDFGHFHPEGNASKILNAIFFNCLNDKALAERAVKTKSIGQHQSPGHKSEASGGLVIMEDLKNKSQAVISANTADEDEYSMPDGDSNGKHEYVGIICGENIELIDKSIPFFTAISDKDLFDENRTKFKSTSLDRLMRFIEIINFFGIKYSVFTEDTKIVLSEREKQMIKDGVMKRFIKMESVASSHRLIEPIFIIEIKLLFEIILSKMS